nr:MAG TPA: hypothetical protein [Caudoviricetes sp.]
MTILFPFPSRYIISNYSTICQIIFYNKNWSRGVSAAET